MPRASSPPELSLPKPVLGWIYNHARKNFWRVAPWYEIDDLINDGIMKAYECLDRYGIPGEDIDPPHFMSLVKTSFHNHIGDLLRHSRGEQEVTNKIGDLAGQMTETQFLDRVVSLDHADQKLASFITKMPEMLRR